MTAADIARLAGVGRAAVSNWRKRYDDFPRPVGGTATSPSFSLIEVRRWLRDQGKLDEPAVDEDLWHELRRTTDEAALPEILGYAGAFLLRLVRDPAYGESLAGASDADILRNLPSVVDEAAAILPGGRPFPAVLRRRFPPLLRGLASLAAERGAVETFEFLRERYLDLHRRRIYVTPSEVVRLVLDLASPDLTTVLDPACGTGGYLLGALERGASGPVFGQDADETIARLTAVRLALRAPGAVVRAGDSLRHDAFPDVLADLVVATPPFNDRNWGYDELTADARWEYGLPPRTESELAWVQHALAHCVPGGQAMLLMPPAAANRRAGRRIRAQLLRRGALRAVFTLPLGAVPNMAVPLNLWVLRRPATGDRQPSRVLMVETSEDYVAQAVTIWRRFEAEPEEELDEPGRARAVRIIDLLDEEVDLTPSRHIGRPAAAPAIERVTDERVGVLGLLSALPELLPEVEGGEGAADAPLVPVAELVRMGLVTVHYGPGAPSADEEATTAGAPPILTADDVVQGRWPFLPPGSEIVLDEDLIPVLAGDVVVPTIVRRPEARVVPEPGAVLGRHLFLLRPDPERLDAHFLAGVLRGSLNLRHYSMMSSSYRVDIRRAEVPLPPIGEQRRYGSAFRGLEEFETKLRLAATLGGDLARLLGDGLADGSLRPIGPARARTRGKGCGA
ncbi:N-6 DNA methylase [Actinomadura litoris]|uniref:N-6 DNA methylase n=1 Tax=Actinomadura litoris TaxID=2678616 RepID=A0A7K1KWL8_9ACTN|nr:N-6 DNA methylase [Actinomadura litoris]MUN36457.1 N-6 DNA methylase [Actinomadura litoris]